MVEAVFILLLKTYKGTNTGPMNLPLKAVKFIHRLEPAEWIYDYDPLGHVCGEGFIPLRPARLLRVNITLPISAGFNIRIRVPKVCFNCGENGSAVKYYNWFNLKPYDSVICDACRPPSPSMNAFIIREGPPAASSEAFSNAVAPTPEYRKATRGRRFD